MDSFCAGHSARGRKWLRIAESLIDILSMKFVASGLAISGAVGAILLGSGSARALTTFNPIVFTAPACASGASAPATACAGPPGTPLVATASGSFNEAATGSTAGDANVVFTITSGGGATTQIPGDPNGANALVPGYTITLNKFVLVGSNELYFYNNDWDSNEFSSFGFVYSGTFPNLNNLTEGKFCYAGTNNSPSANQCGNSNSGIPSVSWSGTGDNIQEIPSPFTALMLTPLIGIFNLRKRYRPGITN